MRPRPGHDAVAGRSVVLTGAAGGLGRVIATALAERGARLLLVDIDGDRLRALCAELSCDGTVADVADAESRARILRECAGAVGPPDVLVNNAGVEKASEFVALEAAGVRRALEVNLLGAVLLTHALLPAMLQRHRGHVVSISSMAAVKSIPFNAVYNTAKAGLVAFSLSLSKELVGSGVSATAICPAAVRDVGMWARASDRLPSNQLVESSVIAPADVSRAVLRALEHRPRRILVGSAAVRGGALLSALSPAVDRLTDRVARLDAVYRERTRTDADLDL